MAGIYIHIPFCRQKCYYCDFYKTVNTSLLPKFLQALKNEIRDRKNYLSNEKVETIYFGGGTPSVLTDSNLSEILNYLKQNFVVSPDAEITFEANPDDLTPEYLSHIYTTGINRLSVGIQSFQDKFLEKMNRRHNKQQAIEAIENSAKQGFNNISIDLIYGLPGLTLKEWKSDLTQVLQLPVQHLSAYHLTYHEGTAFYTWLKKGTLKELKEAESIAQFETLIETAGKMGYEQYEISNFAKNKLYSRHNSAYWMGVNYLGLGPSAHSYNGISRSWNVSHIDSYIKCIENNLSYFEEEQLTEKQKYNEYILTRIRTIWGVSLIEIENRFGPEMASYFFKNIDNQIKLNLVVHKNNIFTLTAKGLFISDEIMTNLMII
jgi:oxygen-independent coproporphyrinogen-3 oxidase